MFVEGVCGFFREIQWTFAFACRDFHMIVEVLPPVILVHPVMEDLTVAVRVTILLLLGETITTGPSHPENEGTEKGHTQELRIRSRSRSPTEVGVGDQNVVRRWDLLFCNVRLVSMVSWQEV